MISNPRIKMQPQKMLKVYELVLQLIFHKSVFYLKMHTIQKTPLIVDLSTDILRLSDDEDL